MNGLIAICRVWWQIISIAGISRYTSSTAWMRKAGITGGRILAIVVPVLLLVMALWVGYGYRRFRDAIAKANDRLDPKTRAALTPDGGSILSSSTNVLVLGSDRRPGETSSRSDSILLIRSDPGKNQIAELSIPRDLRVSIPGTGHSAELARSTAVTIGFAPDAATILLS